MPGALVPATFNPALKESDIYVSEVFKANAIEGDKFMTFNPDITGLSEGAHGNENAKSIL